MTEPGKGRTVEDRIAILAMVLLCLMTFGIVLVRYFSCGRVRPMAPLIQRYCRA